MIIESSRDRFEMPDAVSYFNTSGMGPRLRAVTQAGHEAVTRYAAPWALTEEAWFEEPERLRAAVAGLIGVPAGAIALIPSASYGIALAAKNVRVDRGANIVVLEDQFPSNFYAWQRLAAAEGAQLRVVPRDQTQDLTRALLTCIDARTAVVAIPNCHWFDGEWIDLQSVSAATHACGAALVIDASQSLGALPLDISAVDPDFVVSVGYKWLLGPYTLGYLYASPKWRNEGMPLEETRMARAGSENASGASLYADAYREGARRFDCGEFAQFIGVPMAHAAIAQLSEWGVPAIQAQLSRITRRIREEAAGLGFVSRPASANAGHFLGLRKPGVAPGPLMKALAERGIHVSARGEQLRIAPHLHVTQEDVDRLLRGLAELG